MKIQFIFAPPKEKPKLAEIPEGLTPPLGILYLAAYLQKYLPRLKLKVSDGLILGWQKTLKEVENFAPQVIFISYLTPCALSAYELVNAVKKANPKTITVLGGPHATALPHEPFVLSQTDFVIAGEGEQTSLELIQALLKRRGSFSRIAGLYWKKGKKIIKNKPREFIKNLDEIPFPARDLIDLKDYRGWFVTKKTPETSIFFSRGCPFNCTFCSNCVWKSAKPWLRLRSPKNIVDEMEHLKKDFGIREVFDHSDEFNNSLPHALSICREIKERNLDMPWKVQLRAHPLPQELVKAMAEAGCWYVHLGIESGNQRTLKGIKKGITLEQVKNACALLKKYKIKIFGLFMLFNAWDEKGRLVYEGVRETEKTLAFAKKLIDQRLLDYISWSITTPYPGSQLFEIAQRFNLLESSLHQDWSRWLVDNSFLMKLPHVSSQQASRLYLQGSKLRAYCFLRSGNWGIKDIPLFFKKAVKSLEIGIKGRLGRTV